MFSFNHNTSVSLTCRHASKHQHIPRHPPTTLTFLSTNTDTTSAHTVKHKPASANQPSHRLAISLQTPRADRWSFCFVCPFKILVATVGLTSVQWMSLGIYIRVAKVYSCMRVLFNYHSLFMIHISRGSAGCGNLAP